MCDVENFGASSAEDCLDTLGIIQSRGNGDIILLRPCSFSDCSHYCGMMMATHLLGGNHGAFTTTRYVGHGGGALLASERALPGLASVSLAGYFTAGAYPGLHEPRCSRTTASTDIGSGRSYRSGSG